jgi:hypothetical protein
MPGMTKEEFLEQLEELLVDVQFMGEDETSPLSPGERVEILERLRRLRAVAVEIGHPKLAALIEGQERKLFGKGDDA